MQRLISCSLIACGLAVLAMLAPSVAVAGAPQSVCSHLDVVFFDLGDTLVELDGSSGLFVLRAGAADVVAQLQGLGIRLGIITNVPSDWTREDLEAVMAEPEFLDEFEVVILSSQAPAAKPDPAIYLFSQSQLTQPPVINRSAFVTETLDHIADSELAPTLGARSVGMVGIHLSDVAPDPRTDYTIAGDDLAAIIPILESHRGPLFCDGFESGDTGGWVTSAAVSGLR